MQKPGTKLFSFGKSSSSLSRQNSLQNYDRNSNNPNPRESSTSSIPTRDRETISTRDRETIPARDRETTSTRDRENIPTSNPAPTSKTLVPTPSPSVQEKSLKRPLSEISQNSTHLNSSPSTLAPRKKPPSSIASSTSQDHNQQQQLQQQRQTPIIQQNDQDGAIDAFAQMIKHQIRLQAHSFDAIKQRSACKYFISLYTHQKILV